MSSTSRCVGSQVLAVEIQDPDCSDRCLPDDQRDSGMVVRGWHPSAILCCQLVDPLAGVVKKVMLAFSSGWAPYMALISSLVRVSSALQSESLRPLPPHSVDPVIGCLTISRIRRHLGLRPSSLTQRTSFFQTLCSIY